MKEIETQRLILKKWEMSDLNDLYEYGKDPEIGPLCGWKPHESGDESAVILDMFIKTDNVWAIVYKENGKIIGGIDLKKDVKRSCDDILELGYVLARDYWGKGLMTEAAEAVIKYGFEQMGLYGISCGHFPHNTRSKRVIEKCGFKHEGILKHSYKIFDGTVYDQVCYLITKDDFIKGE